MKRLPLSMSLACLASFALALAPPADSAPPVGIVNVPISFRVVNSNTSKLPCPSDGLPYTVRGRLEAPRSALVGRGPHSVTLYLHTPIVPAHVEWRFDGVPGYDYVHEQARAGHASVTIDRLGFGESDIPPGGSLCMGSAADVAHQVVQKLRRGDYRSPLPQPVSFARVALAGLSGGGLIAEVEAYSYADVDALIVIGWAATGQPPQFVADVAGTDAPLCAIGGEPKRPGAPSGYVQLLRNDAAFSYWMFHDIEPDVLAAALVARERDPCGEIESFPQAVLINQLHLGEIHVPVLLVYGAEDKVYPGSAPDDQRDRFTGSPDVTLFRPPAVGHILTLDRNREAFRTGASSWLRARGF